MRSAAVKKEMEQARCRRRPLPPLLALHILPEQRDRDEVPPPTYPRTLHPQEQGVGLTVTRNTVSKRTEQARR